MPVSSRSLQLPLALDNPAEPRVLPRWGYWTLNRRSPSGRLEQRAYRIDQMEFVLGHINPRVDTFMSQAFFSAPNRRLVNLNWITNGYVDLDTYKHPALAGLHPEQVTMQLLEHCRDNNIPLPSYVIHSGRGYYMKWSWSHPVPKEAAGRAMAVNRMLVQTFQDFGADSHATDLSRILRVVGTENTRSGEMTRLIWANKDQVGAVATYEFDSFANEVLPHTLEEWRAYRDGKAKKAELVVLDHEKRRREVARRNGVQLLWEDWHWKVLCDLETLAERRWMGEVPEGFRDIFGFIGAVQLAHVMNGPNLWREIEAWSRKILPAEFIQQDLKPHVSTLVSKAKEALEGRKTMWRGRIYSPVYTHRKDTLISILKIEDSEMAHLKALISDKVKRERWNEKRRKVGTREAYLEQRRAKADTQAQAVLALLQDGCGVREAARRMGIAVGTVSKVASSLKAQG